VDGGTRGRDADRSAVGAGPVVLSHGAEGGWRARDVVWLVLERATRTEDGAGGCREPRRTALDKIYAQSGVQTRGVPALGIALCDQPKCDSPRRWFVANLVCQPYKAAVHAQVFCDRDSDLEGTAILDAG